VRIHLTHVFVDDQAKAHSFYTDKLGFLTRADVPVGADRWLTVVSPQEPDGPQLLLEPSSHPAVQPFKDALVADGIPAASFAVDDLAAEYGRLSELGVHFTQPPQDIGPVLTAVLDDTCGNLIQLMQVKYQG
jgi:catechol 2,3-dioxygenase-like lactoylglutathione lyase family enzyme